MQRYSGFEKQRDQMDTRIFSIARSTVEAQTGTNGCKGREQRLVSTVGRLSRGAQKANLAPPVALSLLHVLPHSLRLSFLTASYLRVTMSLEHRKTSYKSGSLPNMYRCDRAVDSSPI